MDKNSCKHVSPEILAEAKKENKLRDKRKMTEKVAESLKTASLGKAIAIGGLAAGTAVGGAMAYNAVKKTIVGVNKRREAAMSKINSNK